MLKKLSAIYFSIIVLLSSCQKDLNTQAALNTADKTTAALAALSAPTQVVDTTSKWYADYSGDYDPYPVISDDYIIKNGIAQTPDPGKPFIWSAIKYDIPAQYNIKGDSITFEAKVKNPKSQGANFGDYDLALQLIGEQHNAELHFVADADYTSFTRYTIGDAINSNIPQLVHDFESFETVRLVLKKNSTAAYLNNVQLYKFNYGVQNSIGRLKTIIISTKGHAICTKVGVKSSLSQKLIFSEDFSFNGQTHVVYYNQ